MENKEYLSEETYQKNNEKVKKIGKILLIIGVIALVISFVIIILGLTKFKEAANSPFQNINTTNLGNNVQETANQMFGSVDNTRNKAFGSFGILLIGGFLNFIGFGLTIAGAVMMFISHRREITAYTAQQVMPVAQEGINKMAPTVGNAAKEIAKGIKEGINEADGDKNKE